MSESEMPQREISLPTGDPDPPALRPHRTMRSRLRRFFLRHLPLAAAGVAISLAVLAVGLYFVASSAAFENVIRKRLITSIQDLTGGRAEIASFHWRLLHLEAEADGVVVHGLEDPGEAPYAQIARISVRLNLLGFISPHVRLRDLEIDRLSLHFIVYPDGETNQPQPRRHSQPNGSALDTLFDLHARHIAVEQGILHYDCRATDFDFQDRYAPLDFEANNASLVMSYVSVLHGAPAHYRIQAGVSDLRLARDLTRGRQMVHGTLKATLDLERTRVFLRNLEITAANRTVADHTLEVTGELENFTHPVWNAKVLGDFDMRLLDSITGYPDAPEGLAHLDLAASGNGADAFQIDGTVHVDGGSYIGTGVMATGITLDAHFHADRKQMLISRIVARLHQGGQLEGTVALAPWLPAPANELVERAATGTGNMSPDRNVLVRIAPWVIPMEGKVTANFKDVALDTVLDMVCKPPYRRLGVDARLNGPAVATWTRGDGRTVSVTALFGLTPSRNTPRGESPANGAIDATYTQSNGAVALRKLEIHTSASDLQAHGTLGAYPAASPSAISIDFHSHNLGEFDATLRSLGLKRNGKTGRAALPADLAGQADFHGSWTGSLARPRIAGNFTATQISIEMPRSAGSAAQVQPVHFDSVEALGSYAPSRIVIQHAQFVRGNTRIALNGTLDTSTGLSPPAAGSSQTRARRSPPPGFDANSVIHAHVEASNVAIADVQPFVTAEGGPNLPVTGVFQARIDADGPLGAPSCSGSVEMDRGSFYAEPFTQLRIEGTMANKILKLTTAKLNQTSGTISATGSYDFKARRFQVDAHGVGIDISRIGWVHNHNLEATGILGIFINGSGTLDDPRLEAAATVSRLTIGGRRIGDFTATAHATGHELEYNVTTQLENTDLNLHGQTTLTGDYATHAQLNVTRFDLGTLFRMFNVTAFSGESALAGTATVEGPLAHPEQLRGDAQLKQLAVTVAGVPLQSNGGVHAILANNTIHLDPLHVTGADTDLRVEGSLSLKGAQQLDLKTSGSINLKLAETLDRDLTASGETAFQIEAHGPLQHPQLQGKVDFQNGSLSLEDLPNGLSQLHGTLVFTQNRLQVENLTAMSGGGLLSVGGYLAYEHGLYAALSVTGDEVHIRYPDGVSSLANAKLQLQGSQNNLRLSGDVLITRFTMSPDLDLATLAAQASTSVQTITPPDAPSNHVSLDVHIVSSPQLSFQNAFAKLAGDVDLHLRGTLASPSLLGRVAITEGSAMIAGTRYELQRGDITFTNPVRIEPVIDLSATAHVEDYDISLGLNGTPPKLAVSYRSDPPLPEADVLSLLALGHTGNQQRLYTQQQQQSISNPTDALLGGALNATVSSRVQKLFGAGSVKVDPNYLGAFGNSTSRITVQEQFGRIVTLTYATDVNTTSQQLLQAEVAINRHVSLVIARDESGVFSMVIKATRRYR